MEINLFSQLRVQLGRRVVRDRGQVNHTVAPVQKAVPKFGIRVDAAQILPNQFDGRMEVAQVPEPEISDVDDADLMPPYQEFGDQNRSQIAGASSYEDVH